MKAFNWYLGGGLGPIFEPKPSYLREKAILSCMQFVLHADLVLFAMFCHVVSGRTF
jgi:hypothetical protein